MNVVFLGLPLTTGETLRARIDAVSGFIQSDDENSCGMLVGGQVVEVAMHSDQVVREMVNAAQEAARQANGQIVVPQRR